MPNYISTSPWTNQVDDLGAVFGRLMLNMAQLRANEAQNMQALGIRRGELELEREKMNALQPLTAARTGQANEAANLSKARAGEITQRGGVAQDAGLAQFANLMSSTPGYNMNQTSLLQDTPEVRQALARALLGQALTQSAATAPAAAASMLRPVELNKDADLVNQLTGALLAQGPRSPEESFNLGPQVGRYNTQGERLAFNPAQRPLGTPTDPTLQASRIGTLLRELEELGLDANPVVQGGVTNYVPTQMFQNFQNALNPLSSAILQSLQGTNAMPAGPVRVTTKAERDALAPGTQYIGPDEKTAVKQ